MREVQRRHDRDAVEADDLAGVADLAHAAVEEFRGIEQRRALLVRAGDHVFLLHDAHADARLVRRGSCAVLQGLQAPDHGFDARAHLLVLVHQRRRARRRGTRAARAARGSLPCSCSSIASSSSMRLARRVSSRSSCVFVVSLMAGDYRAALFCRSIIMSADHASAGLQPRSSSCSARSTRWPTPPRRTARSPAACAARPATASRTGCGRSCPRGARIPRPPTPCVSCTRPPPTRSSSRTWSSSRCCRAMRSRSTRAPRRSPQWCQGFLYGLGAGSIPGCRAACRGRSGEIVRDLAEITRAGVDAGESEESNESAYAELVEFVRVGRAAAVRGARAGARAPRAAPDDAAPLH